VLAHDIECRQPSGIDYRISVGSGAVQKLSAKLDRNYYGWVTVCEDPATNAAARLQNNDATPVCAQLLGCGKTSRTSTDYYRVEHVSLIHSD